MTQYPLKEFFANVHYLNAQALMKHAGQLSREINAVQKSKEKVKLPLKDFTLKVKALAPQFLHGQYDAKGIASAILAKQKRVKRGDFKRTYCRVETALETLKNRREISQTTARDRPNRLLQFRKATNADIEKHSHLIHKVMRNGHIYLRFNWQKFITPSEAYAVGLDGLEYAIQTHDPTKGKLEPRIKAWIAQKIGRAARAEQRRIQKTRSIDTIITNRQERRLSLCSEPREPRITENQIESLMRHPKIKAMHLAILALHGIYGHSQREIARHFGAKPQAVQKHYKKSITALAEQNRDKVAVRE